MGASKVAQTSAARAWLLAIDICKSALGTSNISNSEHLSKEASFLVSG